MTDNLLDHLSMWSDLATAYAADPVRVACCWQAYQGGDIRPLRAVIAEHAPPP